MTSQETRPVAKTAEVLSTRLASGEVVVFDKKRNRAHALNPAAAAVWQGCDGQRTVGDLAELLACETGTERDEEIVWLSLGELERLDLLERPAGGPTYGRGLTRREALARVGTKAAAAAVALPIIATVLAPTPASASSCLQSGASCTAGTQCCSGVCASGFCV